MSAATKDGVNETVYAMPKVSVIIQRGGVVTSSPMSYTYGGYDAPRRSKWSIFTTVTSAIIGFCVAVVIFAIPVSLTSVIMIQSMQSNGIIAIKTQEVPSNGIERPSSTYDRSYQTPHMVEPADK